ncbi:hypothetical protein DM2_3265 [Halorubrum sp. DM2]|nr:hypothetical protein DM2_3265 [Halorubrum sp. DM2]
MDDRPLRRHLRRLPIVSRGRSAVSRRAPATGTSAAPARPILSPFRLRTAS